MKELTRFILQIFTCLRGSRYKRFAPVCLFLFAENAAQGQLYNYVQYAEKDGLPSATVYSMIQDKQGFMWFGTEAGLSRFDGINFKTFTTTDGLPDNEILKMHEDSKGRIWLLPFRSAVCYYYKGKIYNQQNDPVLKKIRVKDKIIDLLETNDGEIWMVESNSIYKIINDTTVTETDTIGGIKLRSVFLFEKDRQDRIWFSSLNGRQNDIYFYRNGKSHFFTSSSFGAFQNSFSFSGPIKAWWSPADSFVFRSDQYKIQRSIAGSPVFSDLIKLISINDSLIGASKLTGTSIYNIKTGKFNKLLSEDAEVTDIIKDAEGSIWVSTIEKGIFRIPSTNFLAIPVANKIVYGMNVIDDKLYLGFNLSHWTEYRLPGLIPCAEKEMPGFENYGKVKDFVDAGDREIIVSDYLLQSIDKRTSGKVISIKKTYAKQLYQAGHTLYVATTINLIRINTENFKVIDTVWKGRTTSVYVKKDTVFVGTLRGLYVISKYKTEYWGDKDPLFRSRISSIYESDDGSLWVATYDRGLIQYKNNAVYKHFTASDGMTSNICRTMTVGKESVWVGTEKGISRIFLSPENETITHITRSDGLNSNIINKILEYGDTVFVATSNGVTYFNKTKLSQYSETRLNILDVFNDNKLLPESNSYTLKSSSLKISYAGISYKSAGDIVYKYRLKGVDDEWKSTRETTLEFVSLPYGDYDLEIIAENKFGVVSEKKTIRLHVITPFWKSAWFYSLLIVLAGTFVYLLSRRRFKKMRAREEEKTAFNQKIAEMEMKALRAQMNPHFTFNVLNSIQYFIGYNDSVAAQRYLSRFSKLIRMTLDNSRNVFITLQEEIRLLELYLDLEKMRFEEKFSYRITVDEKIAKEQLLVPNMLVQPFIENAVKHGFKEGVENAEIGVSFFEEQDHIICTITDNGIGRARAAAIQNASGNHHKSAGLSMISDKVDALAYYYNYRISVDVIDMVTENTSGTRVIIKMPKKVNNV